MCVLAFAWQTQRWRLVVAGNRDELHARPAAPLARWAEPDHLLAGRDLLSGGSWLGVSERGRFAVVTNLRGYGPPQPKRPSRGALVSDLLAGTGAFADPLTAELAGLNPFNLILADAARAHFVSNRPEVSRTLLAPGIYGLSNGRLDEPWPKTLQLKAFLLDWLMDGQTPHALLDRLREESLPDVGLRTAAPSDVPLEPALSPIFIRNPLYGTRCSTVVAIDEAGRGLIVERRYDASGEAVGESEIGFSWLG